MEKFVCIYIYIYVGYLLKNSKCNIKKKVKFPLCLIKHYAMKTHRGVDV
jgi:hypothetical protein